MKIDKLIADLAYTDVLDIDVGTEIECANGFVLLTSKSYPRHIPERRHSHPELRRQTSLAGDYEVIAPAVDIVVPASVEGVFDVEVITPELRALRNRPGPDEIQEQIDFIRWVVGEDSVPTPAASNEPPAEALAEAYPDENHAALKARILAEFASLRNMLIGQIPMTQDQLARLVALEHPKFQTWLQG